MKCFNCGYDKVTKEHEFCPICSVTFENFCSKCNNVNPKQSTFCGFCGNELVAQTENIEKQLKVGVIFADISGFTSLAERFSPEETREIINECFSVITKPIYKYNGRIDKYIGDCVMVVFGTVKESMDIPKNTIYCATEMKEAIQQLNNGKFKDSPINLDISIGATYGDVILGNVGTKLDYDYTIIGDVVNTASRLQNYSNPGEIRVGKELYQHTNHIVMYSECDSIRLKNKKGLVDTYLALTILKSSKEEIYIQIDEEQLIHSYINNENINGVLQIVGETGIGKSMLLDYVLQMYDAEGIVKVNLASHGKQSNYSAVSSMVKQLIHTKTNDTPSDIASKLHSFISEHASIDVDKARLESFLSLLLKLPLNHEYNTIIKSMAYQDLLQEIKRQWILFTRIIESGIIKIVCFDNGHFMDEQSMSLIEISHDIPYIVLSQEQTFNRPNDFVLNLSGFTLEQTKDYITKYYMTSISDQFSSYIHKITEGNPMYITELCEEYNKGVKEYKNNKLVLSEKGMVLLPKTLEQLHLQKYNQLSSTQQTVIQIASCFSNDFSFYDIAKIMKQEYRDELEDSLVDKGFIELYSYHRQASRSYNTYVFCNDYLREVIYRSLLEKQKHSIHVQIAEYLAHNDALEEEVGYHYHQANDPLASDYYYKAAKKYHQQFDVDKAEEYYLQYHVLEQKLQSDKIKYFDVLLGMIQIYLYKSEYKQVLGWVDKAMLLTTEKDYIDQLQLITLEIYKETRQLDQALELMNTLSKTLQKTSRNYGKLLQLQTTIMNMTGQPGVIELVDQTKDLLIKAQDYETLAETVSQAGIRHFIEGRLSEGIEYLEHALRFANQINNKALVSKVLINLGILYNQFGERDKSHVYFKNASIISKAISNYRNVVSANINLGVSYLHTGQYNDSKIVLTESKDIAKNNNLMYQYVISITNLADVYYELGEYSESNTLYSDAILLSEKMQLPIELAIQKLGIIKIHLKTGIKKIEEQEFADLIDTFQESNELTYLSSSHNAFAEYFIAEKDFTKANEHLDQSLSYSSKTKDAKSTVQSNSLKLYIMYLNDEDNEGLFKEVIEFASKNNVYQELAKIYLNRHIYKGKEDASWLYLAKEMTMFFDRCSISQEIEEHITK